MALPLQTLNETLLSIIYSSETSAKPVTSGAFISDEALCVYQWICYAVICQSLGVFGAVTTIINIICFIKQGFKDPVNVSLLGLAISDFGSLLTMVWISVGLTPLFQQADLPFDALEIDYLTGGWPHVAFTRITSCITAVITIERCLCITIPLKVKAIITPRRIFAIIICVYVFLMVSVTPVYCVYGFAMKYYPDRNKTIIGLAYTEDRENVEKVTMAINNVFIPFSAFLAIVIFTATLAVKLQRKTQWREKATFSTHATSSRDQVAKMVVIISTLFIACFTPIYMLFIGMILEPELALDGKYKNLFLVVSGVAFILESTNSSMNIFIYHRMSSRYRATFRKLFCITTDN